MENASKALTMAAGVLIGVLIISLAVYLFVDFGTTSAEVNKQNEKQKIVQFNSQFTSYETEEKTWTIYDIITIAKYAKENNEYYEDSSEDQVSVCFKNEDLADKNKNYNYNDYITREQLLMNQNGNSLPTYKCRIDEYHNNGKIKRITFY